MLLSPRRLASMALGTLMMAFAINVFYIPHSLLSGGVTGIAILFHLLFQIDTGLIIFCMNLPLMLLGYFFIDKKFVINSLIGMMLLSLFLSFEHLYPIINTSDFTAIVAGGILNGLGAGLIFRVGASTGGSDIVSKFVYKYFGYNISSVNLAINFLVISTSAINFGLDKAVQTLGAVYIASHIVAYVLEGMNYRRTLLIITKEQDAVKDLIMNRLKRGATIIRSEGSYTGESRNLIYCVINIQQVAKLKLLIKDIDPEAFINVLESKVVFGNGQGFLDIKNEEMNPKEKEGAPTLKPWDLFH